MAAKRSHDEAIREESLASTRSQTERGEEEQREPPTDPQPPEKRIRKDETRIPVWKDGRPLTLEEKINLIHRYANESFEREGHPHGLSASGLAQFARNKGVLIASRQGALGEVFLEGTGFTMDTKGTHVIEEHEEA